MILANQQQFDVSPAEVEEHLSGIDYPASKQDLVQHARNQNAPNEVIQVLEQMPDRDCNSAADVAKGVGKIE